MAARRPTTACIAAIADLKARGLSVVFYPFVMMDIAAGNALPRSVDRRGAQPAFPWRGRITCDPAPGAAGLARRARAAAGDAGRAILRIAAPGADEWSYRRFILHCAELCAGAGGVDAFLHRLGTARR